MRVSTDGELLGNTFYLSTPDTGFKVQPKSALNVSTNEYMVSFGWGPEVGDKETYVVRMDSDGNIQYGPESLYPSIYNTTHPVISFSPVKQQYLVVVNDRYIFSESSLDNIGYVLDKDGNVISGPLLIGSTEGDQFNPQVAYNSVDDTFLVVWEDFRHATSFLGNCEQYGALLDSDGNMLVEIPILDDYGTEDEGKQQNQFVTHNPDNNEFLVAFGARLQPSLEDGGVVGRIVNGDGTLKGDPFVIVDGAKPQNSPQFVYVKDKKQYFMVWVEYKNDTALQPGDPFYYANNTDIFGKWLDPSGEAAGPDIPICTDSDIQSWPTLAYDPVTKRFLIVWLDQNAPGDYEPLGGGGMMAMEVKADIKCAIYGVP